MNRDYRDDSEAYAKYNRDMQLQAYWQAEIDAAEALSERIRAEYRREQREEEERTAQTNADHWNRIKWRGIY